MRTKTCSAWSQDWGRDSHVCLDGKGHDDLHTCKCGARWENDLRDYNAFPRRRGWLSRALRTAVRGRA